MWIERYNNSGEFSFTGDPMRLRKALPIGTFVTHTKTNEVMMVESHEIEESLKKTAEVVVTGRSISTIAMENRIVTTSLSNEGAVWDSEYFDDGYRNTTYLPMAYTLDSDYPWTQAKYLMDAFLISPLDFPEEIIPGVSVVVSMDNVYTNIKRPRVVKRLSTLYAAVSSILQATDIGMKVERNSPDRTTTDIDFPDDLYFVIYTGANLSATVTFDWAAGDLESSRYFFTNRTEKNGFYAANNAVAVRGVNNYEASGWDLRFTAVDAIDWVGEPESGENEISSRGLDAVQKTSNSMLMEASVSKTSKFKYNVDYKLGDIVMVYGNYGVVSEMRVDEYAITEDEHGEEGIPTLKPNTYIFNNSQ